MLKQKLVLNFGSKLITQALQFLSMIVIARLAGPSTLGILSFGLAFVNMFRFIGSMGFGSAHIKIFNETEDKGNAISTYSVLHIASKVLFITVVVTYFLFKKHIINDPFESREHEIVIYIFLLSAFLNTFSDIPRTTFAAATEQAKIDVPDFIKSNIFNLARIGIAFMGGSAIFLAGANLLASIVAIPLFYWVFKGYKFGYFDLGLAKKYIRYGFPLVAIGITSGLLTTLDVVFLQAYTNSVEVGYYSAGTRLASYFLFLAQALSALLFPTFAKLIFDNKREQIKSKIEASDRFIALYFLPLMLFVAIYSQSFIVFIFGEEYNSSSWVFSIAAGAMFFRLASISYGSLITSMGMFKLAALLNFIPLAFFVLSLYVFVNPSLLNLGKIGASLSLLFSYLLQSILFRISAKKNFTIKVKGFDIRLIITQLLTGVIMGIVYYYFFYEKTFLITLIFPLFYFAFNWGILYSFSLINKNDYQFIIDLINPGKMKMYIKNEFKKK